MMMLAQGVLRSELVKRKKIVAALDNIKKLSSAGNLGTSKCPSHVYEKLLT